MPFFITKNAKAHIRYVLSNHTNEKRESKTNNYVYLLYLFKKNNHSYFKIRKTITCKCMLNRKLFV